VPSRRTRVKGAIGRGRICPDSVAARPRLAVKARG